MTDVKTDALKKSIKDILKDADLDSLSAKKIRKKLETEYDTDFTDRKEEIDQLVMQMITDNASDGEEAPPPKDQGKKKAAKPSSAVSNGTAPAAKKRPAPAIKETEPDIDASEEEESDGSDLCDVEDPVPRKKAKTNSSSKSKSPQKLNDEELAKKLHEEEGSRPRRSCKAPPPVKRTKKPRSENSKGNSVYLRPCALLPPLDKLFDTDRLPRPTIVKRIWEIVKERDLLDPKNKQFMLCDEEMMGIFGKRRVRMFGVMKLLKPYIKDLPKE